MHNPSEIDDLKLEQPEESWEAGEMHLVEERPPDTALRSDPKQRKWMMMGVGACVVLTAVAVIALSPGANQVQAAEQPAVEPVAVEQPVEVAPVEPAPVEPKPVVAEKKPKPREKPTLAATAPAAIKKAPPQPAGAPAEQPSKAATPSSPAPSKPAAAPASKPTPAPMPELPAEDAGTAGPAHELPDVEGWDDADAAVEQDDEPAVEAAPAGPADVASQSVG